jgi:hypothetical protein
MWGIGRCPLREPTHRSKHLKVLREAGLVSGRIAAQQRIYRLDSPRCGPWTVARRTVAWFSSLDALEQHSTATLKGQDREGLRRARSRPHIESQGPPTLVFVRQFGTRCKVWSAITGRQLNSGTIHGDRSGRSGTPLMP